MSERRTYLGEDMEVNDGVISMTVPGWVWLLLVAGVMLAIAAVMAKRLGGARKILFAWELGDDSFGWAVLFSWMVGIPLALIAGVIAYFVFT